MDEKEEGTEESIGGRGRGGRGRGGRGRGGWGRGGCGRGGWGRGGGHTVSLLNHYIFTLCVLTTTYLPCRCHSAQ